MAALEENATIVSAVLLEKDVLALRRVTGRPTEPGRGQVTVEVKRVGICGSDVEYWKRGFIADFVLRSPMVIGHEAAGVVTAVGAEVTHLRVGDRVAMEPGIPCRRCGECKQGSYNLCPAMQFWATPPVHGSLCHRVVHDADFCYALPDSVSLEEGALCEPLSVAVHACRRAGVTVGSRVAIIGAGPIGLVCLLAARAYGAGYVAISDIQQHRLDTALALGATGTVTVKSGQQPVDELVDEFLGQLRSSQSAESSTAMFDVVIECCGFTQGTNTALRIARSGGCVVLVGLHDKTMNLNISDAAVREVDIRGVFRYRNCYPTAIAMLAAGKLDVKPLITHRFPLTELVPAFETARTCAGGAIKVMFTLDEDITALDLPILQL